MAKKTTKTGTTTPKVEKYSEAKPAAPKKGPAAKKKGDKK